jgi:two-component system response regulator FixJ
MNNHEMGSDGDDVGAVNSPTTCFPQPEPGSAGLVVETGGAAIGCRPAGNRDRLAVICHDDGVARAHLAMLFRLEGFETRDLDGADRLSAELARRHPDFVVLHLGEDARNWAVLDAFRWQHIGVRVIGVLDAPDMDMAVRAVKAGAYDVVALPLRQERLMRGVIEAIKSDQGLVRQRPVKQGFSALTAREKEVLGLLLAGNSSKAIGSQLGISFRTVEVHRANLMNKIGARNAVDLVRKLLSA